MLFLSKYRYALGYISCVSFASILREMLMLKISPASILLISSLIACFYFHIINHKEVSALYKKFSNAKWLFIKLNLVVALMWFATYYSIYYASATIFVYEFFITGGCLALLFRKKKLLHQKIASFFFIILVSMPFLIYKTFWLGILLGISAGLLGFFYNITSHKIALSLNLSASQTLAVRFWLLIFASLFLTQKNIVHQLALNALVSIIILTFLSFILQIWLNQKSVITIGGKESSFIASFAPALTFFVQGIVFDNWFFSILILSFLGSLYVIYDSVYDKI